MPLAPDTSAQEITMKKSLIPYPDDGLGSLPLRTIGKGEVTVHYYGSLLYAILIKMRLKMRTYSERVIQPTAESFWK